jgi:hypothetical protein
VSQRSAPYRGLTIFAAGFLLLDAILLGWAGRDLHRPGLIWWGVVCAGGALLVVMLWRRHLKDLTELAEGRRAIRQKAEEIRALLRDHHLSN